MAKVEAPDVEAPLPDEDRKTTEDLVNAIWQSGWKHGNKKGWSDGYNYGRQALNTWWGVVGMVAFLIGGIAIGYGADWVHTCHPIAVTDVKSCTTRFGDAHEQ